MEQGAEEEINRLKETLAATSHEMEQIKEDFADRADKLQYAEKLLDKSRKFRLCSHLTSFFKLPASVLHYYPME